jgi:uncharacterized protein (TIGR03083 family)
MDYEEHVHAVEQESAAVARGLRAGSLDVRVPTCPEWTLLDLSTHLGQFCGLWSHVICEGTGRPKTAYADPVAGEHRAEWFADWYEEQAGHLVDQLRATGPEAAVWTWDPSNETAAFIARRAAHELAVHRFDVQSARDAAEPISGSLAVDGIDEIFAMIAAWRAGGQDVGSGSGETVQLHATDRDGEWNIELSPAGAIVERHHAKADLALSGAASDLELVLYQRPPLGPVEHRGQDNVLDAWVRAFSFG